MKLIEVNEHHDDLSYFPSDAIQDNVGFSRCLEHFRWESGHNPLTDKPCVVAQVSNNLFYLLKQNGARKRNGAFILVLVLNETVKYPYFRNESRFLAVPE